MRIDGAVAFVIGGASGLGAGARRFVERGARVVVLDNQADKGGALAEELGPGCAFVELDVADADVTQLALETARTVFGAPGITVNCAGISPAARTLAKDGSPHPLDLFGLVTRINLIGTFDVVRLVASQMSTRTPSPSGERGVIINVASIAALEGQTGQVAYAASKGAVAAMTLPLARDLAPFGIRVLAILPGVMDTPMVAGLDEQRRAPLLDLPLFPRRLGTPEDFAQLTCDLVTNEYLNAEVVRLDAGARLGRR